jgi:peptidoglycan/LPS O-acetylase OafA/YrhL
MCADLHNTSPANEAAPRRIVGLDGLRAISILLVIVGHGWATLPAAADCADLAPYLGNATLGVTTFFVISGYLITHLLRKEWDQTGTIRLQSFYARRVLRIFPALYAYLLTLVLLRTAGWIDTTAGDLTVAATFLTNYRHVLPLPTNDDYWFVGHFWTLALEEQFYLLWPLLLVLVGITGGRRAAWLIVLVSPAVRVASYFLWPAARPQLGMMLHTAADPLMFGCLAALVQARPAVQRWLRARGSWAGVLATTLFLLVVSPWLATQFRGAYLMTVGRTLESVAVGYVLLWVVWHPQSRLTRVLSHPVLCHVGALSYSLYLWQQLFLTPRNTTWTGAFPVNVLMCVVAAELSYWVVEQPFLRLRGYFRPGPQTAPTPGGAAAPGSAAVPAPARIPS